MTTTKLRSEAGSITTWARLKMASLLPRVGTTSPGLKPASASQARYSAAL